MSDITPLSISYVQLKEVTEKRLRDRLEMKEGAAPYDYAKYHAQAVAIVTLWKDIASTGNAPADQVAADHVYFKNILEPCPW